MEGLQKLLELQCKEMTLEDLTIHLKIQGDKKGSERKFGNLHVAKANVIEYSKRPYYKGNKLVGASKSKLGVKGGVAKKYVFPRKCYVCNKAGYPADNCKSKQAKAKGKRPAQTHMIQTDDMYFVS